MRRGFTIFELVLTLATIAVLSAILFPAVAAARGSGALTSAMSSMRQLGLATTMYAAETDGRLPASTNYGAPKGSPERLWTNLILPYAPAKDAYVAPQSDGVFAARWSERTRMTIGMNSATAIDRHGCAEGREDSTGCAAFRTAASLDKADLPASVALLAATPGGPEEQRYDGHEFNPYTGPVLHSDLDRSPPLCADRDLVRETSLPAALLKPVFARYGANGQGAGKTPVAFADGHTKALTAKAIQSGACDVTWRFR